MLPPRARVDDCTGIELLTLACQSLDRAERLAAAVEQDGEIVRTATGVKAHPGIREELAARGFVVTDAEEARSQLRAAQGFARPATRERVMTGTNAKRTILRRERRPMMFSPEVLQLFVELERIPPSSPRFQAKSERLAELLDLVGEWWTCNHVNDRSRRPTHGLGLLPTTIGTAVARCGSRCWRQWVRGRRGNERATPNRGGHG
jgi:hypothetical protein